MLHMERVDLHYAKNKLDHHTTDYDSKQLIVRRGQAFQLTLSLNRALRAEDSITFDVEMGKSPEVVKGTKVTFSLSTKEVDKASWGAFTDSPTTSSSVSVWISPPATAIIGSYRLVVSLFSGGYTSHNLPGFILLFNPWASDDDVYLADESEREEYVLRDSTIIYSGNENHIGKQGWNLGQFEVDILSICLLILEKQTFVDETHFYDPKEVSRVCSAMVNSNDDQGVVLGNWSGDYEDGRSPTSWSGSVDILKKWAQSGPVRYGQCWVFAGVLCTVMRCLGIPTRIVTNFSSAHDTNVNLSIDTFYDSDGNNLGGADTIWNFHAWNEVWLTREDIGSYYDGWQVVDSTPQEKSYGIYRLGPTSVKAVKEGDVHLNYDGFFVFSEVNADSNSWIYHENGESFERIETITGSVGKFTSTKAVGSNHRVDITTNYKYEEGTADEREAYHNALLNLYGRRTIVPDVVEARGESVTTAMARMSRARPASKQDISGKFKELDTPELGHDIDLTLVLSNGSSSDKTITVNFNANLTGYTRRVMTNILTASTSISVASKEEKEIPFKIPYSKYINDLLDDKVVEVTALCKGGETEKVLISEVITLKSPPLQIEILGNAVVHNSLSAEVTFMNPFKEFLMDCEVSAEGSGLIKGQITKPVTLKPKDKATVTIEFTPYMKGSKQLNVVVSCNKTVTIKGFIIIVSRISQLGFHGDSPLWQLYIRPTENKNIYWQQSRKTKKVRRHDHSYRSRAMDKKNADDNSEETGRYFVNLLFARAHASEARWRTTSPIKSDDSSMAPSAAEPDRHEAPKDQKSKGLRVTNIDLQRIRNATAHRTIDYDTSELVLRRGQPCTMSITFNRQLQSGDDLRIIVETGPSASVQRNTRAEMPVSSSSSGTSWSAVRGSSSNNVLNITMNIPANAVIGKYNMNLQNTMGGRPNVTRMGSFILLFNPWGSADEVYMNNEDERQEYVMNETGLYWFGNVNNYGSRRWDYAQFERDILNITIAVLDKSLEYRRDPVTDVSRRNDPAYVGRVLSAMVNSNDDNGILLGNWSGNYTGGVSPTTWNGSAPILRQYMQRGPVKFGQCWVYAGVLCTVLRCLGIPARLIINFQSAHDTDENLIVDNYYDENGMKDEYETSDSIWNFHAWNEAFFVRKDLGPFYNGWQILDATPQEPSQGIFRLGPTSLTAVKEGDVDKAYDAPFVFAEVNADQAHWVKRNGTWTMIYSEPAGVGQRTSTKAVGSFERRDVTNDYKYPEGSDKEREVFFKARNIIQPPRPALRMAARAFSATAAAEAAPAKPEFTASFKKAAETQVGEDVKLILTLTNSVSNPQKIKINQTATAIIYNSKPVKNILTESQSVSLGPNEEKSIELIIPYAQYRLSLTADNMIETVAVCEDEKGGNLLVQTVTTLKNPALLLRAIENATIDKVSHVDVIFTNPIQEEVPNSVLIVEGSGIMLEQLFVNVPKLKPNQRVTVSFEIHPHRKGDRSLLADFSSQKFPNVKGFQTIPVASSPQKK
ncbi:uncharacterized protein ACMZJ9_017776 [Mantella aurantiaca]